MFTNVLSTLLLAVMLSIGLLLAIGQPALATITRDRIKNPTSSDRRAANYFYSSVA